MRQARYAILFHDGIPEPHFDLLVDLQGSGSLATWRSPAWPIFQTTDLVRLRDHRRAYLDYEGEISGGRGFARRVDGGTCELLSVSLNEIELQIDDRKLLLRKLTDEQWVAIRGDANT